MSHELPVVSVRLVNDPPLYSEKPLRKVNDIIELMSQELAQYDREVLCILNLKANGQAINMSIVSMGGLSHSIVSPREIFKCSILSNASRIIALHNHPSGNVTPSMEDIRVTKKLIACGELMEIPLADHIIVGGTTGETFSMYENNMIQTPNMNFLLREPGNTNYQIQKPQHSKQNERSR